MEKMNDIFAQLEAKEKLGNLDYDQDVEQPVPQKSSLGKASHVVEQETLGMESPWKPLPIENLPSEGFGYPLGLEIAIRAAQVAEIRHYSTIDENDPIDVDDKINHILSKNTSIRYPGGTLSYMDLYQEDRFYLFMVIRDLTFIKGENKIMIPLNNTCKEEKCDLPKDIELKSVLLTNFKLPDHLRRFYNMDQGCYILTPKNGDEPIELFIPTIGIVTKIRKILRDKRNAGKKFDEAFASYSTFIIPNWRDLSEEMYDYYENQSKNWTYIQFNIVDQITKEITFATKNQISLKCNKCGAEVSAPLRFLGGLRSLYIISNILGELQ